MSTLHRGQSPFRVGFIGVGIAIAFSSLAVVRAEYVKPDKGKTYTCSTGTACIAGKSTGSAAGVAGSSTSGYGVTATSSGMGGVFGQTTASGAGSPGSLRLQHRRQRRNRRG